jgi:DNA repair protein RecO (recombination protein O)
MAIEKSAGLILRVIPFRDTSKVVTAYTAEHGLVSLLAKGVRGPKPRFGAALELFATTDLVYYQKDSRELQLLSQASLLDPHMGLGNHPERFAYGVAVLEFLLKVLAAQEPPGRLYALSVRTLEVLEDASPPALPAVFRAFQIKAVSFLGHRPELYVCVECGENEAPEGRSGFSPLLGGLVCSGCAGHVHGVLELSVPTLKWMRHLLTATLDALASEPPPADAMTGVARVLEPFLQAHVERYEGLRALRMARSLAERG